MFRISYTAQVGLVLRAALAQEDKMSLSTTLRWLLRAFRQRAGFRVHTYGGFQICAVETYLQLVNHYRVGFRLQLVACTVINYKIPILFIYTVVGSPHVEK